MNHSSPIRVTAPCIINTGTLVSKSDMLRVLSRLTHVRYTHRWEGETRSEGTATLIEVFDDPQQATILADHLLHLNIHSFDYLELRSGGRNQSRFVLVRGSEALCLEPDDASLGETVMLDREDSFGDSSLEFALAHIIAAKLDAQNDSSNDIDDTTW